MATCGLRTAKGQMRDMRTMEVLFVDSDVVVCEMYVWRLCGLCVGLDYVFILVSCFCVLVFFIFSICMYYLQSMCICIYKYWHSLILALIQYFLNLLPN